MGKTKRLMIGIIVQCGNMMRFRVLDLSRVELKALIHGYEYLIGYAKYIALSLLWESVALEQQKFGNVEHDIGIRFTIGINSKATKTLSLFLLTKGTIKEINAQMEEMPDIAEELWLRIAAILFQKQ